MSTTQSTAQTTYDGHKGMVQSLLDTACLANLRETRRLTSVGLDKLESANPFNFWGYSSRGAEKTPPQTPQPKAEGMYIPHSDFFHFKHPEVTLNATQQPHVSQNLRNLGVLFTV